MFDVPMHGEQHKFLRYDAPSNMDDRPALLALGMSCRFHHILLMELGTSKSVLRLCYSTLMAQRDGNSAATNHVLCSNISWHFWPPAVSSKRRTLMTESNRCMLEWLGCHFPELKVLIHVGLPRSIRILQSTSGLQYCLQIPD